jgi:hypothetical protein
VKVGAPDFIGSGADYLAFACGRGMWIVLNQPA